MGFSRIYTDFHVFQPEMEVYQIKYEGKKGWGVSVGYCMMIEIVKWPFAK